MSTREEMEKIESEGQIKMEFATYFSLDNFIGSDVEDEDRLVGFDLTKEESDPNFIIVVDKESYVYGSETPIVNFKKAQNIELALPLKADRNPEFLVDLYDNSKILKNLDRKEIDKKARKDVNDIKSVEAKGSIDEILPEDVAKNKKEKVSNAPSPRPKQ